MKERTKIWQERWFIKEGGAAYKATKADVDVVVEDRGGLRENKREIRPF